ncbi:unnamed protein product [Camellia sinensis]
MGKDTLRWHVLTCPLRSSVAAAAAEDRTCSNAGAVAPSYQKEGGRLSRGVVFIIPPGHPVITVASKNQNLQIVCFDVNALNNEKFPLAGRRNIINQLSPDAKELAFTAPAREVDEVFKNQEDEFFFEGPPQQHEREREHEYEDGCAYA